MIREATLEDVPALVVMASKFIKTSIYENVFPVEAARLEELATLLVKDHVVFIAEQRPTWLPAEHPMKPPVQGMLALALVPHMLTGRLYAEEVAWWVEPQHRNGTVGPRLMHQMECYVRQNRLHMVKMLAPADSGVGDFYRKCGYQALETAWIKVFA